MGDEKDEQSPPPNSKEDDDTINPNFLSDTYNLDAFKSQLQTGPLRKLDALDIDGPAGEPFNSLKSLKYYNPPPKFCYRVAYLWIVRGVTEKKAVAGTRPTYFDVLDAGKGEKVTDVNNSGAAIRVLCISSPTDITSVSSGELTKGRFIALHGLHGALMINEKFVNPTQEALGVTKFTKGAIADKVNRQTAMPFMRVSPGAGGGSAVYTFFPGWPKDDEGHSVHLELYDIFSSAAFAVINKSQTKCVKEAMSSQLFADLKAWQVSTGGYSGSTPLGTDGYLELVTLGQLASIILFNYDRCPIWALWTPGIAEVGGFIALMHDIRNRIMAALRQGTVEEIEKKKSNFYDSYVRRTQQMGVVFDHDVVGKLFERFGGGIMDKMTFESRMPNVLKDAVNTKIEEFVKLRTKNAPVKFD
jgi:hypothetical protein